MEREPIASVWESPTSREPVVGPGAPRLEAPALRPFGERLEDLEVEFDLRDPSLAVTRILAACELPPADAAGGERILDLPISVRVARLIQLVALTEGTETLNAVVRCAGRDCGREFEISLPVSALLGLQPKQGAVDVLEHRVEEVVLRFRRPTGRDQQAWRAKTFDSPEEAYASMARSLLVVHGSEPQPSPCWMDELGEAFEEFDPLASFRVACACAHCGQEASLPLDLQGFCLQRLKQAQRDVMSQVHLLAGAYGWTEAEVLAVPAWRRRHYLARLDAKGSL